MWTTQGFGAGSLVIIIEGTTEDIFYVFKRIIMISSDKENNGGEIISQKMSRFLGCQRFPTDKLLMLLMDK